MRRTLRGIAKLTFVQIKLLLREPPAMFFTLIFPSILLVFFGSVFGNDVDPDAFVKFGYADGQIAAFTALIIGTTALMGIPIATATKREHGVLRRYRATPLHPASYLAADVITNYLITLQGMVVLVILGKLLFHLRFGGTWAGVLAGFTLASLSFFSAGYVIASLAPTGRTAQVAGQLLFFPMMFLSGAAIPLHMMPEGMRKVSEFLPLTHVVNLLRGLWFGEPWGDHVSQVIVLGVMLVVGVAVSAKVFRWE